MSAPPASRGRSGSGSPAPVVGAVTRPTTDRAGLPGTAPDGPPLRLASRSVDGFRVDLEAMARLGADLDGVRTAFDDALRALGDAPASGLGDGDLDRACQEFRDGWAHGLDRIGGSAQRVRDGVERTRAEYAAADAAVAEALR